MKQMIYTCSQAADLGIDVTTIHPLGPAEDCIAIVGQLDDGTVIWHSHDSADIDPHERANADFAIEDAR